MKTLLRYLPLVAVIGLATSVSVPLVAHADTAGNLSRAVHRFWGGIQIGQSGTAIDDSYAVASTTVDIASVTAATCLDTSVTVTGAAVGDVCTLGLPASATGNIAFSCYVSAANTVKIRACNLTASGVDPASGTYSIRTFDP